MLDALNYVRAAELANRARGCAKRMMRLSWPPPAHQARLAGDGGEVRPIAMTSNSGAEDWGAFRPQGIAAFAIQQTRNRIVRGGAPASLAITLKQQHE